MANKRDLKKAINYVCSDVFAECVAASLYNGNPDKSDVDALLSSIIAVDSDYISRVSHPEPGMKASAYYKAVIEEFNKQIAEITDQISNLN